MDDFTVEHDIVGYTCPFPRYGNNYFAIMQIYVNAILFIAKVVHGKFSLADINGPAIIFKIYDISFS